MLLAQRRRAKLAPTDENFWGPFFPLIPPFGIVGTRAAGWLDLMQFF